MLNGVGANACDPLNLFSNIYDTAELFQQSRRAQGQSIQQNQTNLSTTSLHPSSLLNCCGDSSSNPSFSRSIYANSPVLSHHDFQFLTLSGKRWNWLDPVPQSGFKGVSWNSRMKAWLAFYVTENGERKSKTFSTRKLGMEEARIQAIVFCKQKQDQRREARKRNRCLQNQNALAVINRFNKNHENLNKENKTVFTASSTTCEVQSTLLNKVNFYSSSNFSTLNTPNSNSTVTTLPNDDQVAYVPIVPIGLEKIRASGGLFQPLELTVLPPCQHCNQQPYPFLLIVSKGQEQIYSSSDTASNSDNNCCHVNLTMY